MRDLSEIHGPVGQLFEAGPIESVLSADELAKFDRDGFVDGVPLLSESQCDALCAELTEFFEPEHAGHELWHEYHTNESTVPEQTLFHALGAWRLRPGFHDLLWHAPLVTAASQLLGAPARFWHDQLFCKPAHHGGVVAWHQDYSYWTRTQPMNHLTCWIPLDDCDEMNGSLQYVAGSHRWELLQKPELAGPMNNIRQHLSADQAAAMEHPHQVIARRGHAAFHHPLTLHGSQANNSDRPRRAVVVNFIADGVRSETDEPLLKGVPVVPRGESLGGRFFPLLS